MLYLLIRFVGADAADVEIASQARQIARSGIAFAAFSIRYQQRQL